jgi:hypothetical protein
MEPFLLARDTAAHAIVGWGERLRNPSIHVAIEAQPAGYGAIAAQDGINALTAPNRPYRP